MLCRGLRGILIPIPCHKAIVTDLTRIGEADKEGGLFFILKWFLKRSIIQLLYWTLIR
jgi:hypothetical protein